MADVFLSYSRADRERVKLLADALEQNGCSVWWDREIEAGSDFGRVISAELEAATSVIVVWSAASVSSGWVRDEASEGMRRQNLVPVRIDEVDPPLGFRSIQTVDLIGWRGDSFNPEFQRILKRLGTASTPSASAPGLRPAAGRLASLRRGSLIALATLVLIAIAAGVGWHYRPRGSESATEASAAQDTMRQMKDLQQRMINVMRIKTPPETFAIDTLASRYEGQAPDHIGSDFSGNFYYGIYRIQARSSMQGFIQFLRQYYPSYAQRLEAAGGAEAAQKGSESFAQAWRDLAKAPDFRSAQVDYVERSNYQRLVSRLALPNTTGEQTKMRGLGLDVSKRSLALQAVLFSIAVQYGPGTTLPIDALKKFEDLSKVPDAQIIEELYKARDNISVYFPDIRNDEHKQLLISRNEYEKADALYMLQHAPNR